MTGSTKLKLSDGTELFYKDWGHGDPIVFSHGWPLTSDAFEDQMIFLAMKGYRVIAHDRRGHGRSSQPWEGHTMDQYADDLAELVDHLELKKVIHIGHSTGGGEVARYIGRHGTLKVLKAILIGAVPPLMVKTEDNPVGTPIEVFDDIRKNVLKNRSQFFKDLAYEFYGLSRDDPQGSSGLIDSFWMQGMQSSIKAAYDCVAAFSETDQREDLKSMSIPTLVLYGDNDNIVPPISSSKAAIKILPQATEKVYPGASHGLCTTHKDAINEDIYQFISK
ncbi:uncharacterized protein AC631_04575 [Debaryomyces fabryi]|uniref:AB hydrolase-1 domain-containing protein n=1 Tax=Debaryomyces fabryi TaxID=58627 RepID=A0A0V1PUB3_9ASCO|nr:uncharacterized protein AC631_04575 [Debaryomyces fabryi]KRZ99668.1 hypothetical protein AC631_04575 [Debaryomyces fabryi]CUM51192.1 unnamed protein product [Debaryomyces fabryi]